MLVLQVEAGEEIGKALDTGDRVEFSVLLNRKLGTSVAESVRLLCKAEDKRELGQASNVLSVLFIYYYQITIIIPSLYVQLVLWGT